MKNEIGRNRELKERVQDEKKEEIISLLEK